MVEEARLRHSTGSETAGAEDERAAPPIHLPSPSLWPAALGLGVALLLFGVLTHWVFSLAGAALFAAALGSWIAQMLHESVGEPPGHGNDHETHT